MLISRHGWQCKPFRSGVMGGVRLHAQGSFGMSLVEMLVALAVFGILIASAAPSFSTWIQNSTVRTSAESIQNALQIARSEAVHRNSQAEFVSCGGNVWNVLAASATATTVICSASSVTGWQMVQQSPTTTSNTNVTAGQSTLIFNGLGRVTNLAASSSVISVSSATCVSSSSARCASLNVVVSSGGQIRLCNPALAAGSPQGC